MKRFKLVFVLTLAGCVHTETTLPDGTFIKTRKPDGETISTVIKAIK